MPTLPHRRPPLPPAVRLFHTLIRFDHVYVSYFKTNRNFMCASQGMACRCHVLGSSTALPAASR